jgi:hypothetical protein
MSRAQLTSTVEQNTGGAVSPYVAGKNFVINGGMDIWQRNTTFTSPSNFSYTADRWACYQGSTVTLSQETSNVPAGSRYALKMNATGTQQMFIRQVIETANTIPLAGKTITVSAQIAASASTTLGFTIAYSTNVDETVSTTGAWNTLTPTGGLNSGSYSNVPTTYVTLVGTYTVPSTAKSLLIYFGNFSATVTSGTSFYISQVQLELGSVATPFSRAGGTLSGELTACQRYYWRAGGDSNYQTLGVGVSQNSTVAQVSVQNPVPMRVAPTSIDYSTLGVTDSLSTTAATNVSFVNVGRYASSINITTGGGLTVGRPYIFVTNNSTSAYFGLNAEL